MPATLAKDGNMSDQQQILEALQGDDIDSVREAAYFAGDLRLVDAVPLLVKHIQSQHIGVQEAADRALRKIGGPVAVREVIPLLRSDDAPIRNISMDILREIGSHDFPALQSLLHSEDVDIRIFASDILGTSASPLAVPPLCDALLKDPEVNVRYQAAVSLGTLAFPEAAACLDKAMQDEEWVQFSVIEALIKIRAESSVNALVKALDGASDLVASMIVDALGEMGNIKAVPLLLKRLEVSPTPLRNKTVKAIVGILGGKSLSLLGEKERLRFREYMLAAMHDEDEEVQDAAMVGLASVGGADATQVVLALARKLDPDRDHERLEKAIRCLGEMGYNESFAEALRADDDAGNLLLLAACQFISDAAAVALLKEVFWDKTRDVQRAMATQLSRMADISDKEFFFDALDRHNDAHVLKAALAFLGGRMRCAEAGERMLHLLEHPYDDVKEAALEACIALHSEELNERFRESFHSPDPLQRMMAVYALGRFDVDANLEQLSQALEDEVPDVRKVALEAIGSVCPLPEERLRLIVPRLHDENREVRLTLIEQLGACGEDAVIPYLLQGLADEDDWVRIRAIEALGRLKKTSAVPQIVQLMETASRLVLLKIIESLGNIGGNMAFRALLSLMEQDDPEVQQAAEDAAARIREEQGEDA